MVAIFWWLLTSCCVMGWRVELEAGVSTILLQRGRGRPLFLLRVRRLRATRSVSDALIVPTEGCLKVFVGCFLAVLATSPSC